MTRILPLIALCALSAATWAAAPAAPAAPATPATPAAHAAPAAAAATATPATAGGLQSEEDKTAYAIGQIVGSNLKSFSFSKHEMQMVESGFAVGLRGTKPAVDVDSYRSKAQALQIARAGVLIEKSKQAGKDFRARAATDKNTETTATGIVITTLSEGSGAAPTTSDQVKVHYEGKLIDGTIFDSSIQRGEPMTFKLSAVVPCWSEALQHMKVGGKSRILCPSDVAYGDRGSPPKIPGGSTLVFNVELLDIVK